MRALSTALLSGDLEQYVRTLGRLTSFGIPPEDAVQFMEELKMKANDRQVGGEHYKKGGEEHWDRAWRLKYDSFQYIITKWIERWREKAGIQDLLKAQHAIEKYIELVQSEVGYPNEAKDPDALNRQTATPFGEFGALGAKPGHIFNYGPNPLVSPTGWVGFVFEGIDAMGALFTCRLCKEKVRCPAHHCPHDYHTHDGSEPDSRYTNQG